MEEGKDKLIGRRIRSLKPDMDCDEYDRERHIPVGSLGAISRLNHVGANGERSYDVFWDNGAWTVYSESEVKEDLELIET
jgi:hypothetical protein